MRILFRFIAGVVKNCDGDSIFTICLRIAWQWFVNLPGQARATIVVEFARNLVSLRVGYHNGRFFRRQNCLKINARAAMVEQIHFNSAELIYRRAIGGRYRDNLRLFGRIRKTGCLGSAIAVIIDNGDYDSIQPILCAIN